MPRSKNSSSSTRSRRAKNGLEDRRFEPTVLRRAAWVVAVAVWVFLAVALVGFDLADPPSTLVSTHQAEVANPAGTVGASLAWWAFRVFGPGVWILMALAAIALVTLARGIAVTHPLVRTLGAFVAAVTFAGLHHAWIVPFDLLTLLTGSLPGLPSGLLGTELDLALAVRFGDVGSGLILMMGLTLGLLVAADELVLAAPGAVGRWFESMRGFGGLGRILMTPFSTLATAIG
ncbi:MAG: DNA translocase FtsK 4TM domain-containing protein, partial [Planctomycetota bacterium]|nr:DNA translocase FtsK 4TM domain-containing protein [Planctomycetota bacterium]